MAGGPGITGRTYHCRGQPVTVLAQWSTSPAAADLIVWLKRPRAAPRNVLIVAGDGRRIVRPFRGLRKERN
jgi:hypothetical protein